MTFEVIPAIDVSGGRLVRMSGPGIEPVDAFGGDPVRAAETYVAAGASRLHVVDVDLAVSHEIRNVDVVARVAAAGVPVQASGGVTDVAQVETLLEAGADRVVLGSAALAAPGNVRLVVGSHGDRVLVAIEADGAVIRPRGGSGDLPMWDTLQWLTELSVPRFLFTEVGRVSTLEGPDLDGVWALATHTGRPVLASGGIRGVEDLRALAALGGSVEGAIVGRALHEGLDLREAMAAVG
ncbi:MAG TPA: HisA/HisF-related TIM barrel protein [Actinomycetota bacterium]|nr:HisA/HisF-related TIM barrel protein [Actinomycetota bacterium]